MIDPRDESLYQQYYIAWVTSGRCPYDGAAHIQAIDAVAKHRALFPLPAVAPASEPWRTIIEVLWGMALKPVEIVRCLDTFSARDTLREIDRLIAAGVLEESDDGTVTTDGKYCLATIEDRVTAIAAALGGSHV